MPRPAWVDVDLDAIAANTRHVLELARPASLCAVVKADAYGHGDVPVAEVAIGAGASRLAVATVSEGVRLREAGLDVPILLLGEAPPEDAAAIVRWALTPSISSRRLVDALAGTGIGVELAVDSGMHRAGAAPPSTLGLARAIHAAGLRLVGTWTHFSVADSDTTHTSLQLGVFHQVLDELAGAGIDPGVRHAAASAGLLHHPASHLDEVRVGLALYGLSPDPARPDPSLRPALSVRSKVVFTHRLPAGARPSYGRIRALPEDATIGVVPVGYADGYPRGLGEAEVGVLVGGVCRPLAGRVTMDQVVVDLGEGPHGIDDEVVLLGAQGDLEITADDWAAALGTISYEVVSRLGPRLPRRYSGGGRGG